MHAEAETTNGRISGLVADGVAAFKGVPYGADTSGENRFMPPRKPAPWAGVRDALAYVAQSPQSRVGFSRRRELEHFASPPDTTPESEDCLTLSVWTPKLPNSGVGDGAKRPVMVWLHGGAFSFGSANSARLDGTNLARRGDVVVVTVNQRLNIFGHLDLSPFGGAEFAASGNAGTLDMIAALEWVRDNVEKFGGDPGNVTIFGESGGGGKVSTLMAMPLARGLFHRAVVQSGAVIRLRERERAASLTDAVLKELGLGRTQLLDLQRLPMARLLAAVEPATKALGPSPWPLFDRYPFGPVVDGTIVPRHPFAPDAPDLSDDIPLLVGDTKDEASLFLSQDDKVWEDTLTESELRERVEAVAGVHTDRVIETYRRVHPGMSPGGAADRHADGLQLPHPLADDGGASRAQIPCCDLHVFLRLGDAGVRRPAEIAARDGRAVYLRDGASAGADRPQRAGSCPRGADGRHLGGLRAHRQAGSLGHPALAGVHSGAARDVDSQ